MLNTFRCEITHLDACIWVPVPASKHWILIFTNFFLICLASFHCSGGFHALDLWVSRWLLRGVVMTYSTDQQLFIPPGLQIIHIYASGSRLFSGVAAILRVDQSHLLRRAQSISTSSRAEDFLFGCPCQGTAGEGCKDSNTEAESAALAGRQTQNKKKLLGFAQIPMCGQQGPPEVSSEWKEPHWCMVKAMPTDVLPPVAKRLDILSKFPLFSLFWGVFL